MTHPSVNEPAPIAFSRRHFTALLALGGVTSLSACGGGGSSDGGSTTPAPPPAPPTATTLSLVAGGLGGTGLLDGAGTEARMPGDFNKLAVNASGDAFFTRYRFTGGDSGLSGCGFISRTGQLLHLTPPATVMYDSWVVADAQGQFLISLPAAGGGWQLHRWNGSRFTTVANEQGEPIHLIGFATPVLDSQGSIWYLDYDSQGRHPLRRLSADGQLHTVTDDSPNGTLVWDASGQLMLLDAQPDWTTTTPRNWHVLTTSSVGQASWQAQGKQWPAVQDQPIAAVSGSPGVFWTMAGPYATAQVKQRRTDGTDVRTWTPPAGALKAVALDSITGQLLVAMEAAYTTAGVVYRMNTQTGQATEWCGAPEQRGLRDGAGAEARFDFSGRTEAFTDPTGDLYVASGYITPMQSVSAQGMVRAQAFPKGVGNGLTRAVNGDWLTIATSRYNSQIQRAGRDGASDWKPWIDGYTSDPRLAYLTALRLDAAGQLWFSAGTPTPMEPGFFWGIGMPTPPKGGNVLGQIAPSGQIGIVAGTADATFSRDTYPSVDQRPWYYDITDFGLESAAVGWLLCNRKHIPTQWSESAPNLSCLVRVEGSDVKTFVLPEVFQWTNRAYTRLCLLPGRPGDVFLASHSAVFRWTEATGLTVLAGNPRYTTGVKLGALPAGMGEVKFLVPGPTANSLYVGSENSVLRLELSI